MRNDFRHLRLLQLDRVLVPFQAARSATRPPKGWIHSLRQALGVSSGELARRLGTSRQLPLQLEKAEAEDRITLRSLRAAASALDCDLVYAVVPRAESLEDLLEKRAHDQASALVREVEHSMALENQAVGHVDGAIEAIARRLNRKRADR